MRLQEAKRSVFRVVGAVMVQTDAVLIEAVARGSTGLGPRSLAARTWLPPVRARACKIKSWLTSSSTMPSGGSLKAPVSGSSSQDMSCDV